jgi:hypothetical protein
VQKKHTSLQDIREVVEAKPAQMLASNSLRMDYHKKYQEMAAGYSPEKDRATVEATRSRRRLGTHSLLSS